jgi:hypothetical protein
MEGVLWLPLPTVFRIDQDELFTNDEHAVLSDWFGQ